MKKIRKMNSGNCYLHILFKKTYFLLFKGKNLKNSFIHKDMHNLVYNIHIIYENITMEFRTNKREEFPVTNI